MDLVPVPGSGRVFAESLMPGGADAGPGGRVRLDALACWIQDIAWRDLVDSGFDQDGNWIVRRQRMAVERFPAFGERVEIKTWCSGIGRFSAERRTSISGEGGAAVEAVAIWAFMDMAAMRPVRFDRRFEALWGETAGGRGAKVRLSHPGPPDGAVASDWEFRATDVDLLEHVNNANYWLPLEEEMQGGEDPETFDAEIEFHEPARAGRSPVFRSPEGMWITSAEGSVCASILVGGS